VFSIIRNRRELFLQNQPKLALPWLWATAIGQICNIILIPAALFFGPGNDKAIDGAFSWILDFFLNFYFFVVVHSYHCELCDQLGRRVNQPQRDEAGYVVQYQQGVPNTWNQPQSPSGALPEQQLPRYYPGEPPPPYNPYPEQYDTSIKSQPPPGFIYK
jgi:hypothetical protein